VLGSTQQSFRTHEFSDEVSALRQLPGCGGNASRRDHNTSIRSIITHSAGQLEAIDALAWHFHVRDDHLDVGNGRKNMERLVGVSRLSPDPTGSVGQLPRLMTDITPNHSEHPPPGIEVRWLIVELNLHPHGTKRLNEMRLIRPHEAGMARFKNRLRGRMEHLITQSPFKHPDDAPNPRLSAMFPTQSGGQGILIEDRGSLIRFCC
jgi:hypothetical protein